MHMDELSMLQGTFGPFLPQVPARCSESVTGLLCVATLLWCCVCFLDIPTQGAVVACHPSEETESLSNATARLAQQGDEQPYPLLLV